MAPLKPHGQPPAGSAAAVPGGLDAAGYNAAAPIYDEEFRRPRDVAEAHDLRDLLRRQGIATSPRILDVGCGTGLLLDLFPEVGPERYVGIDASEGMLRQARLKHPAHTFLQTDMNTFLAESPSEAWSSITYLFAPLNYARRPADLIAESFLSLKPSGVLFALSYAQGYVREHQRILQGSVSSIPSHFFTPRDLAEWAGSAGFSQARVESFHSGFADYVPYILHRTALRVNRWLPPRPNVRFLTLAARKGLA